jgi:outer membrane immunogenic protein
LASDNHRGATYGVQGGYNFQRCNIVIGIEGDWSWMDGDNSSHITIPFFGPEVAKSQLNDLGSVRGRAGVVVGDTLLYATAGWAWANAKYTFSDPFLPATVHFKTEDSGITLLFGAGTEFQLRPGILLRAEYLHYAFDRDAFRQEIFSGPGNASFRLGDVDTVRLGLSFKFDHDRYVTPVPLK